MNEQIIENEFQQIRAAARTTSVNILSLRIALVDKGLCTEEELDQYDQQAAETIDHMMNQELQRMAEVIRKEHGDEVADRMLNELAGVMNNEKQ